MFSFRTKPKPLNLSSGRLPGTADIPLVSLSGTVLSGSEGNAFVAAAFGELSRQVDIQACSQRLIAYDWTALKYDFGDHLGAFFWNQPALLDGVAILVAAGEATRRNLESLRQFIGPWLPVQFYDSVDAISAAVQGPALSRLVALRDTCSQRGRVIAASESGVHIVLLGSRQLGFQFRTRAACKTESDLDCAVVGGPRELALLSMKLRKQPIQDVAHPPIRGYASVEEALNQKLMVIAPQKAAASQH